MSKSAECSVTGNWNSKPQKSNVIFRWPLILWKFSQGLQKTYRRSTFGEGHKFSFKMYNSQPVYTLHPLNIFYGPLSRWLKNTAPEDTGVYYMLTVSNIQLIYYEQRRLQIRFVNSINFYCIHNIRFLSIFPTTSYDSESL
jgi:hypothetical protein